MRHKTLPHICHDLSKVSYFLFVQVPNVLQKMPSWKGVGFKDIQVR